uniref:DDE Tnp4 domain-containing protein n=1 Tax=Amphimedon queenslandica TaxID=400682 RepID=A0A1X7VVW4_AMPQE
MEVSSLYRLILFDIGGAGRQSDGGTLSNSQFVKALESEILSNLGTTDPSLPYVVVGDEAFPLQNMLRPYQGRNLPEDKAIFNYKVSRARRVIEKSFGILIARWRIFRCSVIADPTKVVLYIQAAIALHNFLRSTESSFCPPGFTDGEDGSGNFISGSWRNDEDLVLECIIYSKTATDVRDDYKSYLNSPEGKVYWQMSHCLYLYVVISHKLKVYNGQTFGKDQMGTLY